VERDARGSLRAGDDLWRYRLTPSPMMGSSEYEPGLDGRCVVARHTASVNKRSFTAENREFFGEGHGRMPWLDAKEFVFKGTEPRRFHSV
jgi:hypothetical protein